MEGLWGIGSGHDRGDELDISSDDQSGRSMRAATGPAVVVPGGAKKLFEAVVGSRQIFVFIAVEQATAVAFGHLEEVFGGLRKERRVSGTVLGNLCHQGLVIPLHALPLLLLRVFQDMGCLMHPTVSYLDVGPERGGCLQAFGEESVEPN